MNQILVTDRLYVTNNLLALDEPNEFESEKEKKDV